MKRWTVMLIPHERGDTSSFSLSTWHVCTAVGILLTLAFTAGFFYQRNRVATEMAQELAQQYQNLETTLRHQPKVARSTSREGGVRVEQSLRKEYEARDAALLAELGRLYDLETEVRSSTGLPPRDAENAVLVDTEGGKGGGPSDLGDLVEYSDDMLLKPPQVIYGLSRPSADLIMQEINVRSESLTQLLASIEKQEDRIARLPSIWPTKHSSRRISSGFGNRQDPFTRRLRHHGGLDFSADYGTPVLATAKGVVTFSAWEKYYGNLVRIDHGNGIETWYGHLSERTVEEGDVVDRSEVIGKVGATGRATGPHIHYEVHQKGKRVDPAKYIPH